MTFLQWGQEILNASLAKKRKAFHFESLGTCQREHLRVEDTFENTAL